MTFLKGRFISSKTVSCQLPGSFSLQKDAFMTNDPGKPCVSESEFACSQKGSWAGKILYRSIEEGDLISGFLASRSSSGHQTYV